jgi:hypothetical protein
VALFERAEREVGPIEVAVRHALKAVDGILDPDHIAENYWHIHRQPRTAWTFEMDLRPYREAW